MTESNRATREQEQYDVGLDRDRYESVLSYSDYFYRQRREKILRDEMEYASSRVVLELGSVAWSALIEPHNIRPAELHCINISQAELEKGVELAETSVTKPKFSIMDANHLDYEDKFFDVVFGFGILHHLDYTRALDEILRVLKSDGKMIFFEPLDNNPIGKIVRFLTPHARTIDEKPLKFYELREFKKRFEHKEYYEGFLSVPLGVISKFLFKSPDNIMTRFGYKADLWIDRHFPFVRPFYRHIVIVGQPKV